MFKATALSATLAVTLLGCASGQSPSNTAADAAPANATQPAGDGQPTTTNPVSASEPGAIGSASEKDGKAGSCGAGNCGANKKAGASKDGKAGSCGAGNCGAKKAGAKKDGKAGSCGAGSCGAKKAGAKKD
ncbi:MAG TPA: hypothetical protein ENK23_01255, partial [Sorangium sp.]|nr:hypothetical protein [Sorangium sp.]